MVLHLLITREQVKTIKKALRARRRKWIISEEEKNSISQLLDIIEYQTPETKKNKKIKNWIKNL